jgi:formylglycine-generating enzyme required for sulfatase activity
VSFVVTLSTLEGLDACYVNSGSSADPVWEPLIDFYNCDGYRLPTEAEWEYAARAGVEAAFQNGSELSTLGAGACWAGDLTAGSIDDFGHYCDNAAAVHPVGELDTNDLGLVDIAGNVWEWCNDWYDGSGATYADESTDPVGPTGTEGEDSRILRGGAWDSPPDRLRLARRGYYDPREGLETFGLRVARTAP